MGTAIRTRKQIPERVQANQLTLAEDSCAGIQPVSPVLCWRWRAACRGRRVGAIAGSQSERSRRTREQQQGGKSLSRSTTRRSGRKFDPACRRSPRSGSRDQRPDPAVGPDVARAARADRLRRRVAVRARAARARRVLRDPRAESTLRCQAAASGMIERFTLADRMAHWLTGDRLGAARGHRPHPLAGQGGAPAAHRLHAVLVARGHLEEPAQLHRPDAHRRGAVARSSASSATTASAPRISGGSRNIIGYFKGHEYPSGKFNAGEKLVFWVLVVLFTTVLSVSGLVLVFPNFEQTRSTMQLSNIVHMVAAYVAIALACVHIYLGTIGMPGAYRGDARRLCRRILGRAPSRAVVRRTSSPARRAKNSWTRRRRPRATRPRHRPA